MPLVHGSRRLVFPGVAASYTILTKGSSEEEWEEVLEASRASNANVRTERSTERNHAPGASSNTRVSSDKVSLSSIIECASVT